jgi:hypothetical protein
MFPLGRVLMTRGVSELASGGVFDPLELVRRHVTCDWGDICSNDKSLNDAALLPSSQARVHSAYNVADKVTIWIITEHDRSATTLLLPTEY